MKKKIAIVPSIIFLFVLSIFFYLLLIERDTSKLPSNLLNKNIPQFETESLLKSENFISSNEFGDEIVLVQIAGLIARRIVCEVKENEEIKQGEKFGIIRFGSRVDLYFDNYEIMVQKNQKTIAGETLIAKKI